LDQNVYSTFSARLIAVHNAKLDSEKMPLLVNYLMKNGKMTEAPKGYESKTLFDFYNENIDFNSYLIGDNYSAKFRADFATEYNNVEEEGIAGFGEKAKIDFPNELPNKLGSGKYNTQIEYSWETSSMPWGIVFTKMADLVKLQTELGSAKLASNALLSMPIDGKMAANSQNRDYGILFSEADDSLKIAKTEEGIAINATEAVGGTITPSLQTEYLNTKNGEILKITSSEMVFSPSRPVTISMPITPLGGKASVLYGLFKAQETETMINSPVFKWVGTKDAITDKEIPAAKGKAICDYIDNNYIGLDNIAMSAGQTYKTIAFLPAGESYLIKGACASQSASITIGDNKITIDSTLTEPKSLDLPAAQNELTENTVQSYLEKIGTKQVCVIFSANTGEMSLKWNTAEIAKAN
ncbi:MAG: hypothetical protein PHD95_02960, partial [Candidatus ainarchaeum sp.]|nr:hypothetical protein [Candidatus ainarchaeum sp.]